jgi:hypothetical protein
MARTGNKWFAAIAGRRTSAEQQNVIKQHIFIQADVQACRYRQQAGERYASSLLFFTYKK